MPNISTFTTKSAVTAICALLLAGMSISAFAGQLHKNRSGGRLRAGVLTCGVSGGAGFVFGSTKDLRCRFETTNGKVERYKGTISKYGLDVGVTGHTVLTWAVLAPSLKVKRSALAGHYVGASAEASAGIGGGANLLVGGSSKGISLQPLSVQSQTGVNAALAVSSLRLKYLGSY
ncbi:MAG: DUF992 domain-containing protein [Alphaproteobacteria bacterium]